MRIAVLNWRDIRHPHAGGAEVVVHQQARGLAARGHEVTLFTARYPGASETDWIDGYRVVRRGGRFGVYAQVAAYIRRHQRSEKFDVVLEHATGLPWFSPLWSPAPTVAYFYHVIGSTYFRELPPPLAAAGWAAERFAPSVYRHRPSICLGAGTLGVFEELGYQASDFQILPPGIDLGPYATPGPKSPGPSLVVVGRIKGYKRIDLAVSATAQLRHEYPGLTLDVVGPDPDGLAARLAAQARTLGIGDAVRFYGRLPEPEKAERLRSAWINLVPSDQEGWGLTVLEAAACGTPSVGSDIRGLTDTIVPGVTGLRFRQGDAGDLAREIRVLLQNDGLRRALGNSGGTYARSFTWEHHVAGLETVLEGVPGRVIPRPMPGFAPADRRALLR